MGRVQRAGFEIFGEMFKGLSVVLPHDKVVRHLETGLPEHLGHEFLAVGPSLLEGILSVPPTCTSSWLLHCIDELSTWRGTRISGQQSLQVLAHRNGIEPLLVHEKKSPSLRCPIFIEKQTWFNKPLDGILRFVDKKSTNISFLNQWSTFAICVSSLVVAWQCLPPLRNPSTLSDC